jgi:palmitoyltransferase
VLIIIIALTATEAFLITLLAFHSYLIMTNQTTYELTRRKRIPYLRGLPDKAHPFSKGLKANVYSFCSTSRSEYPIYVLPSPEELEARAHSSSCLERQFCSCC